MNLAIQIVHWAAGLAVLAEALNKLERTCPLAAGLSRSERLLEVLKGVAWAPLALGAGGAVITPVLLAIGVKSVHLPLMRLESATLGEAAVMFGVFVLIVRTRVKEG